MCDGRGKAAIVVMPSMSSAEGGGGSVRWYERAFDYWESGDNCGLDDDGVLGGYGHISPADIEGSAAFLDKVKSTRPLLGDEKAAGNTVMRYYSLVAVTLVGLLALSILRLLYVTGLHLSL